MSPVTDLGNVHAGAELLVTAASVCNFRTGGDDLQYLLHQGLRLLSFPYLDQPWHSVAK